MDSNLYSLLRYSKVLFMPFEKFQEKEDTLIILLSAWDRSCDSTAKINLSKGYVEDLSFYRKRCTFPSSSYAKKANEDEQDHCNWVVRTHIW